MPSIHRTRSEARPPSRTCWARITPWIVLVASCGTDEPSADLEPGAPPHVVLISLDTVRADALGCYGHPSYKTPQLDAFADASVRFVQATAAAPTTLAAHTSMLTGTLPQRHGVPRNGYVVHASNRMLPERLQRVGYHTAGFIGALPLAGMFGFDQGFDHFDDDLEAATDDVVRDTAERRAGVVTDQVLAHVDRQGSDQPLFLFAHYFDVHAPYEPPAPYDAMYPRPGGRTMVSIPELHTAVEAHQKAVAGEAFGVSAALRAGLNDALARATAQPPSPLEQDMAALYGGELSYVDAEVGRLLAGLESAGILDDALVIVTADHGETFWEHGDFWNHGLWVYETTVRVPLLVRYPDGWGAGSHVDTPVSLVDVVPTVLEVVGAEAEGTLDGVSLRAVQEEGTRPGIVVTEATQAWGREDGQGWRNRMKPKAVREGEWKYVEAPYLPNVRQLFDLSSDPGEQKNRLLDPSSDDQSRATAMRTRLIQWARAASPWPEQKLDDADVREQLQRLGYEDR